MAQRIDITFRPISKWPRAETASRKRAAFKTGYEKTLALMRYEISRIQGRDVVIQVDLAEREIRLDGWPRADARPRSPRVIVSFESKHGPLMYPCDRFNYWQDNLRAIALALEALRKVDRYGVTSHGEQYTGWRALPAPTNGDGFATIEEAATFMSLHCDYLPLEIGGQYNSFRDAYRMAAMKLHPDRNGGAGAAFKRLQKAREMIEAAFEVAR